MHNATSAEVAERPGVRRQRGKSTLASATPLVRTQHHQSTKGPQLNPNPMNR
ncbi:hypothetical protein [Brevifollis gellanilyticus]|uniref:hypothetical protein n=1 Tax=Brevifollis gellanilyticus TaxID=748831 RepID=UPI001478D337|nr:hypothetical protein [Brevifollis gellanilyticus]